MRRTIRKPRGLENVDVERSQQEENALRAFTRRTACTVDSRPHVPYMRILPRCIAFFGRPDSGYDTSRELGHKICTKYCNHHH